MTTSGVLLISAFLIRIVPVPVVVTPGSATSKIPNLPVLTASLDKSNVTAVSPAPKTTFSSNEP